MLRDMGRANRGPLSQGLEEVYTAILALTSVRCLDRCAGRTYAERNDFRPHLGPAWRHERAGACLI